MGEPAMNRLRQLRSRLASLRRRRRLARWTAAYSALAVALLWALIAALLGDWLFDMNYPQRLVAIVACTGAVAWAFSRFTRPWLGWSESVIDMALLVQRQQHIDSDLVAALQFESPEAAAWGSLQLEEAVIRQAAEVSGRVRPVLDVPSKLIARRLAALTLTSLLVAVCVWWFPGYVRVFLDRLLFRSVRYPTHTVIESVTINGVAIDLSDWGQEEVKCPYGQALRLEVSCSGETPSSGQAWLTTEKGGARNSISLDTTDKRGAYAGQWPRLVDAARLEIFAGDARTDPLRLVVVPPPTVDVQFEVTPPRYAAAADSPAETVSGLRQLSVAEGSRVVVRVRSDKDLKEAVATIESSRYAMARAAGQPSQGQRDVWAMDPAGTPLAAVVEPARYAIQVTDVDGLSLERPIEGVIRVKTDHPPDVVASALTTLVLPAARPTLAFTASDDYGLAEVAALAEVVHGDGSPGEKVEVKLYTLPTGGPSRKNVQNRQRFPLAPLKAVKGDQVKVTLRAIDDRGGSPGKSTLSEPLLFQVTDEQGIYAAMSEADRESARRLQTMIENQIDVGGGK
jgi:hypothetical protein